jgi:hypothetical protein
MDRGHRILGVQPAALALATVVAAGCGGPPVSQATASVGPAPSPATSASVAPGPSDAPPPSDGPTDAPPTSGPAGIPDKPEDVTFEEVDRENLGQGDQKVTFRITWSAPDGVATEFTLVGVKECLRYQERFDGKPCLVRGMRIPKSAQDVMKSVDGDKRSAQISWREGEIGAPPYSSVLIRASNDAGDSIFTIVWSDNVCYACVY